MQQRVSTASGSTPPRRKRSKEEEEEGEGLLGGTTPPPTTTKKGSFAGEDDLDHYNRLVHLEHVPLSPRTMWLIAGVTLLVIGLLADVTSRLLGTSRRRGSGGYSSVEAVARNDTRREVRVVCFPGTPRLDAAYHREDALEIRLEMTSAGPPSFPPPPSQQQRPSYAVVMRQPWRRAAVAFDQGIAVRECRRKSVHAANGTVAALEYHACVSACASRMLLGRRCVGLVPSSTDGGGDVIKTVFAEVKAVLDSVDFVADGERWHSAILTFAAKFDLPFPSSVGHSEKNNEAAPLDHLATTVPSWLSDLYRDLAFVDDAAYALVRERHDKNIDDLHARLLDAPRSDLVAAQPRSQLEVLRKDNADKAIARWYATLADFPGLPRLFGLQSRISVVAGQTTSGPPVAPASDVDLLGDDEEADDEGNDPPQRDDNDDDDDDDDFSAAPTPAPVPDLILDFFP